MSHAWHRSSIRGLMIAIGIIAVLLSLPPGWAILAALASLPLLAILSARWLFSRAHGDLAGLCFWIPALLINLLYVAAACSPGILLMILGMIALLVILPTLASFGVAWAAHANREVLTRRFSPGAAWLSVVTLSVLPLVTSATGWPFWLRFQMARPALERMASRVAAGQVVISEWAGPFLIVRSAFNPASGNVGLMIDPDPNGPSAFVRTWDPSPGQYGCFRPIRGDWYHHNLGGGWCYHEED